MLDALAERLFARIKTGSPKSPFTSLRSPAAPSPLPAPEGTPSPDQSHNSLPTLPQPSPTSGQICRVGSLTSLSSSSGSLTSLPTSCTTLNYDSEAADNQFSQVFSEDEFENIDAEGAEFADSYDNINDKRGSKVPYTIEDKLIVNGPIMQLLDWRLLAPLKSELFRLKRKKNGTGFKKHADLVFNKFKEMIKAVIRSLVAKQNNYKGGSLTHRYFWCAYDLTRKRRANHVQNWRKSKCPKDLIYGGRDEFIATYGDPWSLNEKYTKSKRKRRRKRRKELSFEACDSTDPVVAKNPASTITEPAVVANSPAARITEPAVVANSPAARITEPVVAKITEPPALFTDEFLEDSFDDEFDDAFDVFESPKGLTGSFTCAGCGEVFERKDALPRNNAEWSDDGDDLRCARCFDQRIREEFLPEVRDYDTPSSRLTIAMTHHHHDSPSPRLTINRSTSTLQGKKKQGSRKRSKNES